MRHLSADRARRIALGAQGFADRRPTGRVDVRHFRRVLDRVGVLQLDSVNVLARSHYLPVLARIGPYERPALDRFTAGSGEVFEYWGHQASLIPSSRHRLFRWRMAEMKPWRGIRRLAREHPGYVESVYEEVRDRGPLSISDLSDAGERSGPWWGYNPGKLALEWLFARGRITAYRGRNFERIYDLPERVVASEHVVTDGLSREDAYRRLLLLSARHHGVGTARDLADYYRLHVPSARRTLADLEREGLLEAVEVEGWRRPAYLDPDARTPRQVAGSALLSPFDSLIWERDRTERIFGFRYRVEIYVPEPDRVHGYYVLPYLLDGRLVARVDLKAHRKQGALEVRGAFAEADEDREAVASRLAGDLETMASWLGLDRITVSRRGDLASALAAVL